MSAGTALVLTLGVLALPLLSVIVEAAQEPLPHLPPPPAPPRPATPAKAPS